ncbi:spectrin alpha chain-like, partial [Rhinophrynus dorsalis]
AESWVRGKLRDLKDACDSSPLQDWEQRSQALQRDISGFEGTVTKLIQMTENLCRNQSPSTASLRSQLQTLRDQWQLLKQTAANQSKALGGAKALQEFNRKADELEMWMREKEEKPSLSLLLDENNDKVQLTRRILDLKQEQIHYRNLQESINSLAQKLEKQGRAESKGTSTRRKNLNKMWLRLQDTLQEHQVNLQLALETASLWQQADTVLRTMEGK